MGLIDKVRRKNKAVEPVPVILDLDAKEVEFLITVLGESNIKVKQIEFVYSLLLKIQRYYIYKTSGNS